MGIRSMAENGPKGGMEVDGLRNVDVWVEEIEERTEIVDGCKRKGSIAIRT